jgi:hypothetical protein
MPSSFVTTQICHSFATRSATAEASSSGRQVGTSARMMFPTRVLPSALPSSGSPKEAQSALPAT